MDLEVETDPGTLVTGDNNPSRQARAVPSRVAGMAGLGRAGRRSAARASRCSSDHDPPAPLKASRRSVLAQPVHRSVWCSYPASFIPWSCSAHSTCISARHEIQRMLPPYLSTSASSTAIKDKFMADPPLAPAITMACSVPGKREMQLSWIVSGRIDGAWKPTTRRINGRIGEEHARISFLRGD